jgi:hypothetical protein
MAQWELLETSMWVNIQRITGVAHCANVVWPDLVRWLFEEAERGPVCAVCALQ